MMKTLKKIKSLSFLILFFSFVAVSSLMAEESLIGQRISIESVIRKQVADIFLNYDPSAFIRVDATFRPPSPITLPGLDFQYRNNVPTNEEIQNMTVTITTAKNPVPKWLEDQVRAELTKVTPRFQLAFAPLPAEMTNPKDGSSVLPPKPGTTPPPTDSLKTSTVLFTFGALWLLSALIYLIHSFLKDRKTEGHINTVAQAIKENSAASPRAQQFTQQAAQTQNERNEEAHASTKIEGDDFVRSLPADSFRSLIADCYWCEKDRYAAWLWLNATPAQRSDTLQKLNYAKTYIAYALTLSPEHLIVHEHPDYMASLINLEQVSQKDLTEELNRNPELWSVIPALRKRSINLPLLKRIDFETKFSQFEQKAKADFKTSAARVLPPSINVDVVQPEDEIEILKNPKIIPAQMRYQISSLVWVAVLPLELRSKLLEEYETETLASVWFGAKAILEKLAEALPEKKRQILGDYQKTIRPSNSNPEFRELVLEGIRLMEQK